MPVLRDELRCIAVGIVDLLQTTARQLGPVLLEHRPDGIALRPVQHHAPPHPPRRAVGVERRHALGQYHLLKFGGIKLVVESEGCILDSQRPAPAFGRLVLPPIDNGLFIALAAQEA
jgi:hypothetical protein